MHKMIMFRETRFVDEKIANQPVFYYFYAIYTYITIYPGSRQLFGLFLPRTTGCFLIVLGV